MPSTLSIFTPLPAWRLNSGGVASATPPVFSLPDFLEERQWTSFLANWCEPGQAVPRIGFQGTGAEGEIVALHEGLVLRSAFQPIFSASPLQPVAFEALVRAHIVRGGQSVSPYELFSSPRTQAQGVLLDR